MEFCKKTVLISKSKKEIRSIKIAAEFFCGYLFIDEIVRKCSMLYKYI
jgi:hypothetical protein